MGRRRVYRSPEPVFPAESPLFVKRIEPGLGMGVTLAIPENENHHNYQQLLDSLAGNPAAAVL